MMRTIQAALPALLAVAALLAIGPAPASSQGVGPAVGTELPDFMLTDLEGNEVQIREVVVPDKPAVIEIWASWCAICRSLAPQFERLSETYGDDVSIVAIAVAINQSREDVAQHVERFGHDWAFLYDGEGRGVRALEAFGTGIVILVDRDGKIAFTGSGAGRDLMAEVETLLDGG